MIHIIMHLYIDMHIDTYMNVSNMRIQKKKQICLLNGIQKSLNSKFKQLFKLSLCIELCVEK